MLVERNSDSYRREQRFGSLADQSQLNVGLEWRPHSAISATVSYQHGDYWGLTLRSAGDFKTPVHRKYQSLDSSLDVAGRGQAPIFLNLDSWYDKLLFDAERSGLRLYSASQAPGSSEVTLEIANDRYAQAGDAMHQALLLSELHLPNAYRYVNLLVSDQETAAVTVRYQRQTPNELSREKSRPTSHGRISILPPSKASRPSYQTDFGYPHLRLGADLSMRVQLMDPNEPLKHQLYVRGTAALELSRNWNLWSSYTLDLTNNFNTKRPSDSVLPRVRSDINRYLTEGENGIDSFYIEYKALAAKDLIFKGYGGVLEEMFGGVGGDFLWSPFMKRWALGLNLNWVKQRDFSKDFSFQDYSVFTGHLSMFYASPWYDFDVGVHVGRYLAGDRGFTLETRRTFDNGFSIGAFFTRTNVSKKDFGEGSFDKGLYLRFPSTCFLPLTPAPVTAPLFGPLRGMVAGASRASRVSFGGIGGLYGQMRCSDRKLRWFLDARKPDYPQGKHPVNCSDNTMLGNAQRTAAKNGDVFFRTGLHLPGINSLRNMMAVLFLLPVASCSFHSAQWESAKALWAMRASDTQPEQETYWWVMEHEGESYRLFPVAWDGKTVLTDARRWMIVVQQSDILMIETVLGISRFRSRFQSAGQAE